MRISPSSEPAGFAELALLGRTAEAVELRLAEQKAWARSAASTPPISPAVARGSLLPLLALMTLVFLLLI